MKVVKIVGGTILGIIIIGLVVFLLSSSTIHPNNVFIKEVNVSDSQVTLKGTFIESARQYKGYKIDYKNEGLYIKIKGALLSFSKTKEIDISIANKYGRIEKIYLQGDTLSVNKRIWPEK